MGLEGRGQEEGREGEEKSTKGGQELFSLLDCDFEAGTDPSVHILQTQCLCPQCLTGDLDLVICFTLSHGGSVLFPLLSEHQSFNQLTLSLTVSLGIDMGSCVNSLDRLLGVL